jgi:site-specific DNA recombinase
MVQMLSPKKVTVLYPLTSVDENNKGAKKRVAAYCRVSTNSDEQLNSFCAQISYYESLIKRNSNYDFAGIYADEGISGTNIKNRDSFLRMLQDARDGQIDLIITKSISRFGRNTLDCLKCIRELRKFNVDVYFERENLHTFAKEGELLISLLAAFAQQEIYSHSENVKWGKRRKFQKGDIRSIPWNNITGFSKNKAGEVVIVEDQAAIIRRIYNDFLAGYGVNKIADQLNKDMIPLKRGKKWLTTNIQELMLTRSIVVILYFSAK